MDEYIHIQRGDVIGIHFMAANPIQYLGKTAVGNNGCTATSTGLTLVNNPYAELGTVMALQSRWTSCRQYSVMADVTYLSNHMGE